MNDFNLDPQSITNLVQEWYDASEKPPNTITKVKLYEDTDKFTNRFKDLCKNCPQSKQIQEVYKSLLNEFDKHGAGKSEQLAKWVAANTSGSSEKCEGAYKSLRYLFVNLLGSYQIDEKNSKNLSFESILDIDSAVENYMEKGQVSEGFEFDSKQHVFEYLSPQSLLNFALTSKQNEWNVDLKNTIIRSINMGKIQIDNRKTVNDINQLDKNIDLEFKKIKKFLGSEGCAKITNLQLVGDFSGYNLKIFPNLKFLSISNYDGEGIYLGKLKNLKEVNLYNSPKLKNLYIENTGLEKINFENVPNIIVLKLSNSNIEDITSLKNLPKLVQVDLSKTKVKDISCLASLKKLCHLNLNYTFVEDVGPLKNLGEIKFLSLSNTKVENLNALKNLKNLKTLLISGTLVNDLGPLQNLLMLRELYLSNTKVEDASSLGGLINLIRLVFKDTGVNDISCLENLKELIELDLSGTKVKDIGPLEKLNLKKLILSTSNVQGYNNLKKIITII